jgi:hypothetical protein
MNTRMLLIALLTLIAGLPFTTLATESVVYQVYRPIDLGYGLEPPPKDFYVGLGQKDGLKKGSSLDVYRKTASFDALTQKHAGDHMIPVARLKIIHVESGTAIARLEQYVSMAMEPVLSTQSVMVGDWVRPSAKR